jgi:hypothetical protein
MGDFGRYVVESGLDQFSRYRTGQDYPDRVDRKLRLVKRRWKAFESSLSAEQRSRLNALGTDPQRLALSRWALRASKKRDLALSDEQWTLLEAVLVYPKHVDDDYPAAGACRWVFRRTISLGWTPKLFGRADRSIGRGRMGREAHKAERWGKKYQWMAYHELLARVADNYQAAKRYADNGPYEGLHQIIGAREIDPSLPPIDFRAFNEDGGTNATAWAPSPIRLTKWPLAELDFNRYKGSIEALAKDRASEPSIEDLLFAEDEDGESWVVLEGFARQVDPQSSKSWRGIQQQSAVHTIFMPSGDANRLLTAMPTMSRNDLLDLMDTHGHVDCCYIGEVGRVGPACPNRHDVLHPLPIDEISVEAVATTEKYAWEGGILDCSIGETARAVLPSTFVQQAAGLSFDTRGPSWLDPNGAPVFTYYNLPEVDAHALLVKASFLKDFMKTRKIELVATTWFERMLLDGDHAARHPYVEVRREGRLGADLVVHASSPRRESRNLDSGD